MSQPKLTRPNTLRPDTFRLEAGEHLALGAVHPTRKMSWGGSRMFCLKYGWDMSVSNTTRAGYVQGHG